MNERLMERAWKLQEETEREKEQQADVRAMRDAEEELGLDPRYIEQARAQLEAEEALAHAQRQRFRKRFRKRLGIGGALTAGLFGLGALIWALVQPPPPVHEDFTGGAGRWSLDVNPGTQAAVRWEEEGQHGAVAVIEVERFAAEQDGKFRTNLNQVLERDLDGYQTVRFAVRGEGLGVVRVFLETPDERWRSPPVAVTADWQVSRLPLSSFERQVRGGGWKGAAWEAPGKVQTVSFKVGHFMNEIDATGRVYLDDLRLE